MLKKHKEYYKKLILDDQTSIESSNKLISYSFIKPSIICSIMLVFFIYSLIEVRRFSGIVNLSFDTVLNHIVFINANLYYYLSMSLLIALCLSIIILLIIFKKRDKDYTQLVFKIRRIYDLPVFILTIICTINLIILFLLTPVTVSGNSMANTLNNNDKLFIKHVFYKPQINDIVIFDASSYGSKGSYYVKRIKADSNSIITFNKNPDNTYIILIDGVNDSINELTFDQYNMLTSKLLTDDNINFYLKKDEYLVFGDNQLESIDSKTFGPVNKRDILGEVVCRYYPFKDFKFF